MIGPQNSTLRCLGFWPQFCNVFGTATIGSGRWCRGGEIQSRTAAAANYISLCWLFQFLPQMKKRGGWESRPFIQKWNFCMKN